MDYYVDTMLSQIIPNFKVLELDKNTYFLAGNHAYKLIFTSTFPPPVQGGSKDVKGMKGMEFGTIVDNKLYIVQYLGIPEKFPTYLPIAQEMIDSFEIT